MTFGLVAFGVCLLRPADAGQRFTFGSEDASVFASQARSLGIWRSFHTTYAGYYHLLPRFVGAIASALPLRWSPPITFCAAAAFAAIASGLAYFCARGLRLSVSASLLVAAVVLLLPAAGYEMVGNLPNVEWYCLATVVVFVAAWLTGYQPPLGRTVALLVIAGRGDGLSRPAAQSLLTAIKDHSDAPWSLEDADQTSEATASLPPTPRSVGMQLARRGRPLGGSARTERRCAAPGVQLARRVSSGRGHPRLRKWPELQEARIDQVAGSDQPTRIAATGRRAQRPSPPIRVGDAV